MPISYNVMADLLMIALLFSNQYGVELNTNLDLQD